MVMLRMKSELGGNPIVRWQREGAESRDRGVGAAARTLSTIFGGSCASLRFLVPVILAFV